LIGAAGDDGVHGGEGTDFVNGGPDDPRPQFKDDDSVDGGPGDGDVVLGDLGPDSISGGDGLNDSCDGGPGHDNDDGGCETLTNVP
jgi:RTX calcium-binding nonapeptide repeat (4 copies)